MPTTDLLHPESPKGDCYWEFTFDDGAGLWMEGRLTSSTRDPRPSTRGPRPSIRGLPSSTIDRRPAMFDVHPSTFDSISRKKISEGLPPIFNPMIHIRPSRLSLQPSKASKSPNTSDMMKRSLAYPCTQQPIDQTRHAASRLQQCIIKKTTIQNVTLTLFKHTSHGKYIKIRRSGLW